jgi:acyl carrier protein
MQDKNTAVITAIKKQINESEKDIDLSTRLDEIDLDSLKFMLLLIDLQGGESKLSVDVKKVGSVETVGDLTDIITYTC